MSTTHQFGELAGAGRDAPVAIITGAGSGVGRALAVRLGDLGYSLALGGRRPEAINETAGLITSPRVVVPTDVKISEEVERLVSVAAAQFGRLDVLVNNAGVYHHGGVESHTPDGIDDVFRTNAVGAALAIRCVWPMFRLRGSGVIINVSSSASCTARKHPLAYAASKSAMDSMTACCAAEGAAIGIRAYSINPGYIETPMLRSFADEHRVPPTAVLGPEAVAELIADCIRGRRLRDNGQTIRIDASAGSPLRRAARFALRAVNRGTLRWG